MTSYLLSQFCSGLRYTLAINRLETSNVGCHIGHQFIGAFSYADDFTLMVPSLKAAQLMLVGSEKYAKEYDVMLK